MLIEDVACPVDKLPDMMIDLIAMFQKHGYEDASCFGHALEGNLHLVFSQGFRDEHEIQRFTDMFEEMCYIVATKHSGSLKGGLLACRQAACSVAPHLFTLCAPGPLKGCSISQLQA
jgi:FAD/FMN-containing dehydrogenase